MRTREREGEREKEERKIERKKKGKKKERIIVEKHKLSEKERERLMK